MIDRNCEELLRDGFPLKGRYVGIIRPSGDPRIAPSFSLMGRVDRVDGQDLVLTDSREGIDRVLASGAHLEKAGFDACLDYVFGVEAANVKSALNSERADLRYGPKRLDRLNKILDFLRAAQHQLVPGVPFSFGHPLSSESAGFPRLETAPRPTYVFDPPGRKTSTWHDKGLNDHGPYTSSSFTPTTPRVCVVCQASRKGDVERFLGTFINGVSGLMKYNYFEKGFVRKYALKALDIDFFTTTDPTAKGYSRACEQAIYKQAAGHKWDLAFVQIEEGFHRLPPDLNPYFMAKVHFLTHQIPVQEFEIETALSTGSQLSAVLNNMGLAVYAKLNGIPWLLKANPTIAHELVIGLGAASVGEGRLGDRERFVGITTVFNGDGNYHLSSVSKAVTVADYQSALLESLRGAIDKVKTDYNWQPKEHVRLVFHAAFKPFNDDEIESVKALMNDLGDYDVEYAFLLLSEDHPYLLFDTSQSGKYDFETKGTKGVYAPERGKCIQLSAREMLLCITGARDVKRPEDGLPRPVLIKLHPHSSFQDLTYLTRQAFVFACHSWRTFLSVPMPVTIQYSDLIARKLGSLAKTPGWSPQVMWGRIGRTRWFL